MGNVEDLISKLQAAVAEAESTFGSNDVRVSYKLDELASALKANGKLLDAANVTARAKTIRSANFAKETAEQDQRYGAVASDSERLTAVGWLNKLHRLALIASAVLFLITLLIPARDSSAAVIKGIVGSTFAATFLQLLLFPIKSLPRYAKWVIVGVGSGIIGFILFR